MRIIAQILIGALFSVLSLATPASAENQSRLLGLWKLVAFHTEDVLTKARSNVYGDQPMGYIRFGNDGRFHAWAAQIHRESIQSKWDEVVPHVGQPSASRGIFYSGSYRVNGDVLMIHTGRVVHEGWVGVQAFDMSWDEGRTADEEVRHFQISNGPNDRDILRVETAPLANPNGAGNVIIGRLVWERSVEWE